MPVDEVQFLHADGIHRYVRVHPESYRRNLIGFGARESPDGSEFVLAVRSSVGAESVEADAVSSILVSSAEDEEDPTC